jgi:hypothetical protein
LWAERLDLRDQHYQGSDCQTDQRPFEDDFHGLARDLGIFFVIFDPFIFF